MTRILVVEYDKDRNEMNHYCYEVTEDQYKMLDELNFMEWLNPTIKWFDADAFVEMADDEWEHFQ